MGYSKLNVGSLFSGIGAFEKGLSRQGIPFETKWYCEIDKYASKSYSLIHNIPESFNLGDISKVNPTDLPDVNMITYGFPCQDISVAGAMRGIVEGHTRSGLVYQALRIIKAKMPEYAIMENVKNLTGKKFIKEFKGFLEYLDSIGYNNYYQVLNAKDFEIPQNRERVFCISIRKDIDKGTFKFPEARPLTLRLKDMLEPVVDEKFYIAQDKVDKLVAQFKLTHSPTSVPLRYLDRNQRNCPTDYAMCVDSSQTNGVGICAIRGRYLEDGTTEQRLEPQADDTTNTITTVAKDNMVVSPQILPHQDISYCIDANYWKGQNPDGFINKSRRQLVEVGMLDIKGNEQVRRVYAEDGISPCLNTMQGGNRQPKVLMDEGLPIVNATKQGYEMAFDGDSINLTFPTSKTRRGRVQPQSAGTLDTACQQGVLSNYRIRRLTPKECFRLQAFEDRDYALLKANGISDTQIYKMAGNSICVSVIEAIYQELFGGQEAF